MWFFTSNLCYFLVNLSKITGIRYDTICKYCSGNITLLNEEYLKIFCDVLDCQISDIIEYVPKK